MVDKISSLIGRPIKDLQLRLHIELTRKYSGKTEYFARQFEYNEKEFLNFDLSGFITLENKDGDWSRDKSIMITEKNIYEIKKGFKTMVRNLYQPDIFVQKKNGEIILPSDMKTKYTVNLFNIGMNQNIILEPAVIFDNSEVSYEGVNIFFNKKANVSSLSVTEFESLTEHIGAINLFLYSHQLMNLYLNYIEKLDKIPRERTTEKKVVDAFADKETVTYKTTSIDKKEFFNLDNQIGG